VVAMRGYAASSVTPAIFRSVPGLEPPFARFADGRERRMESSL
jgi:hypothetical protein